MLVEFRVPIPLSLSEFQLGQPYMIAQRNLAESEGGKEEGIESIRNEPYDNLDGHWGVSAVTGVEVPRTKGQYTLKRYHVKSQLPSIVTVLAPAKALWLLEESWDAYPRCKTVFVNGYLSQDKFRIDMDSIHLDGDRGDTENALGLPAAALRERKVVAIDIRDAYGPKSEKPEWDANVYKSSLTGRGPLAKGWQLDKANGPVCCAYKLVRVDFRYFGLQGTVEGKIRDAQRDIFCKTLCQAYATVRAREAVLALCRLKLKRPTLRSLLQMDEWMPKTMADVRALEAEVASRTEPIVAKLRAKGEAPPLKDDGYWLARDAPGACDAPGATAAAGAGGAGESAVPYSATHTHSHPAHGHHHGGSHAHAHGHHHPSHDAHHEAPAAEAEAVIAGPAAVSVLEATATTTSEVASAAVEAPTALTEAAPAATADQTDAAAEVAPIATA